MRFRGGILVGVVMVLLLVSIQLVPVAHSGPAVRMARPHTFPLPHPQRRVMARVSSSGVYGGGSRAMVWGRSCPGCAQWPTIANADLITVEAWRNGAVAVTEAGKMVPLGGAIPAIGMGRPYISFDSLGVRNNDVVKVAAGWSHVLFLRGDGSIDGWGDNNSLQISIPDESLCGCIVDIAAGSSFSLFLRDDGTVFSWGSITLADGTAPVEVAPLDIASASNVVKIGAGVDTMYVLYNDGTMSWWGRAPDATSNATINALTDVVDFDVAGNQGIAIKANGDIVGWGSSAYFSSNGLTGNLFANTHTAVAASVGYSFGLVLRDDGTVLSYGYPENGYKQKNVPATLKNAFAVAAGDNIAVALNNEPLFAPPDQVLPTSGAQVTISGEYLDGVVKVLVDANPTLLSFSATKSTLTFIAPRHAAGKAQLVVYSATGARYLIPLTYSASEPSSTPRPSNTRISTYTRTSTKTRTATITRTSTRTSTATKTSTATRTSTKTATRTP